MELKLPLSPNLFLVVDEDTNQITGEIAEADIIVCDGNWDFFASQNPADLPMQQGQQDLWGVLVHELGHNMGLSHPFEANPPSISMCGDELQP